MLEQKQTTLEKEFAVFHENNPHIWELFKRFTNAVQASGRTEYSAYAIFERIRWHMAVDTNDDNGFKLNNNHRPYYARMYQAQYPNKARFFRTRVLKNERNRVRQLDFKL